MNYKIEGGIRRNRGKFIFGLILWLFLVIVFVVPLSYALLAMKLHGGYDITIIFDGFIEAIGNPFKAFFNILKYNGFETFVSTFLIFTISYVLAFFIGFAKSMPKNRYSDIEHGSSDWSQRGEQYKVLNRDKGIILAENNYLPVDKVGNVNVLVVGRIWIW